MKKLVVFLMGIVTSICIVACGYSNKDNEVDKQQTLTEDTEQNSEQKSEDKQNESEAEDNLLSYPYQVPGKAIVVDVPNYHPINRGYTQLFNVHGIKYIAITVDLDVVVASLTEAHTVAFEKFKKNIQTTSYVETLTIHNEEVRAVNGVEVYRYEGVVGCAKGRTDREWSYDAYVIGYSFIMDGVPCTITGSVIDKEQPQDMIEEMEAVVDAMIETLRSEK